MDLNNLSSIPTPILDLNKAMILSLEKNGFEIDKIPVMATKVSVDRSGSMGTLFNMGWVDDILAKFVAMAVKFDDDGVLDTSFFNSNLSEFPSIVASKFSSSNPFTKRYGINAEGGTSFCPSLEWAFGEESFMDDSGEDDPLDVVGIASEAASEAISSVKKLFSGIFKKKGPEGDATSTEKPAKSKRSTPATYLGMITDGDAYDFDRFVRITEEVASPEKGFIQVFVIGNEASNTYMLRKMTDYMNRYSNVDVKFIPNPTGMSTDEFFDCIANEKFKAWVEAYNS